MNVRINLGSLKDERVKAALQEKLQKISAESELEFQRINQVVQSKLG
jgi:formiminotetrahydrofolate cyclodeaminase